MKFRFTIGRKIGTGFGVLILLTLIVFILTQNTLDSSREINDEMLNVHTPSVDKLQQLKIMIVQSKMYITSWVYFQSPPEAHDKIALKKLTKEEYPEVKKEIEDISTHWNDTEQQLVEALFKEIEVLFALHDEIKSSLTSFESYEEPEIKFYANILVEAGGDIDLQTQQVLEKLDGLIYHQRNNTKAGSERMINSFDMLEAIVRNLGIALVLGGILIAVFTVRSIVKPVQQLKKLLLLMGKGIIPSEKMKPRNDEIGEMSVALNDLVDGFKRTNDFAKEVGSGNFESDYKPLSEHDTLGHSLLAMRRDLYELTSNLEHKVKERTEEVVRQKERIEEQKKEMEVLYTHVTDSIKYAKRIQEAILPPDSKVKKLLPNSFILYKPKDIVSGDFYWMKEKGDKIVFSALDCTGHGVPGAFMTIVGHNKLNQVINEVSDASPAKILDGLNEGISATLNQDGEKEIKDGMDAAMCSIDFKTNEVEFAGANNPLYLIRDGEVQQIKGNKFPVGAFVGEDLQKFTNHKVQLEKGDTIYIFSDGYPDQFGGPKGKKYMYKNFRKLLLKIQDKDMIEQHKILNEEIESWRGDLEQVDDMLIIGLRVE